MTEDLDQFALQPFDAEKQVLGHFSETRSRWILLAVPIVGVIAISANAIQGTLGLFDPSVWISDIRYALGTEGSALLPSNEFPLLRDLPTLIVFAVVGLTAALSHWQWRTTQYAVPKLIQNSAFDRSAENLRKLSIAVQRANDWFALTGKYSLPTIVGSAVTMLLIMVAQYDGGVLQVLAEQGASATERSEFAQAAYDGWWAGASRNHLPGVVAYFLIGTTGIWLVFLQNVVGVTLLRFLRDLHQLEIDLGVDEANADNKGGWKPIGQVVTTVYVSVSAHSVAMSIVLFLLTLSRVAWAGALLVIWVLFAPIYILGPFIFFRSAIKGAKETKLASYRQQLAKGNDAGLPSTAATLALLKQSLDSVPNYPLGAPKVVVGFSSQGCRP